MYDIEELEHQWQKYHRKRLLRRAILGIGVLLLIGAPILYVMMVPPIAEESGSPETQARKSKEHSPESNRTVSASPKTIQKEEVLKPESPSISSKKPKKPKMLITLSNRSAEGDAESTETEAEKRIRMEMIDVKNSQVVKEIEARFPATRDYDDAMYLAKYYYGKKKYKKAEYWAMQANSIDSTKEESWIVFGKAKARQGHRADALRVLQAYYDRSGSMRVKELIHRIRKGKPY
jgi:hypothetical protein